MNMLHRMVKEKKKMTASSGETEHWFCCAQEGTPASCGSQGSR